MFKTVYSFYRSAEWENLRVMLMQERTNEDGELICAYCGQPIFHKYDCIGHHKTELTEENVNDYEISLNPDNIELIHFKCHNRIHERVEGYRRRVFLVYGAPCSGKSTFVKDNANEDDLILDVDRIWEAVCGCDKYHKPGRLKQNVFGIRDCMLDQIRTRTGNWRNAWVIGGYPLQTDRDRLCELLNAEPVYVEATKEECLLRANDDAWRGYIEDWFDAKT